jgi:Planctomycete cytochrome C
MGFRAGLYALALVAIAGCPSEDAPPMCITVDTACTPLYAPTFTNVYTNTLKTNCGSANSSCHSASGMKGGLSFATEQAAYDNLMNGRVTAGDAACSEFVVRTSSPGTDYEMPPGAPLSASARCALLQWVQAGAPR